MKINKLFLVAFGMGIIALVISCEKEKEIDPIIEQDIFMETFEGRIDLDQLADYADQAIPPYITKDNSRPG